MNGIELSEHLRLNYKINGIGRSRKKIQNLAINDADYLTSPIIDGRLVLCPAYNTWKKIVERCNGDAFKKKNPTYEGVRLNDSWVLFSTFREWWLANYRDGFQIDKDLINPKSREYGPESCIYVPSWLNKFVNNRKASRGLYPLGVERQAKTGRYKARCGDPINGGYVYLGYFDNPADAHHAWLKCKMGLAERLRPEMDKIDNRIFENVMSIIANAE